MQYNTTLWVLCCKIDECNKTNTAFRPSISNWAQKQRRQIMPILKTRNLFISHSWAYGDAYEKLVKMLDAAPKFKGIIIA